MRQRWPDDERLDEYQRLISVKRIVNIYVIDLIDVIVFAMLQPVIFDEGISVNVAR